MYTHTSMDSRLETRFAFHLKEQSGSLARWCEKPRSHRYLTMIPHARVNPFACELSSYSRTETFQEYVREPTSHTLRLQQTSPQPRRSQQRCQTSTPSRRSTATKRRRGTRAPAANHSFEQARNLPSRGRSKTSSSQGRPKTSASKGTSKIVVVCVSFLLALCILHLCVSSL